VNRRSRRGNIKYQKSNIKMTNQKLKSGFKLKSTNESKLWLALLRDSKRAKSEDVAWFLEELDEFSNIFASSILTLKRKR